ncbi:MAG: acyl-CoA reductase [Verrucomicrobiota bacterium]
MNLPNYFLADLPPEATLSPAMIAAACDTLKRNREKYLLTRTTDELVKILCEVAVAWLQPDNQFRRLALKLGPEQTGFSSATLARGLDDFFHRFTPENFQALLARDLGEGVSIADARLLMPQASSPKHHYWRGPDLLVHIAAGNLPNPAWMSLTLGLIARSAQFMKCASSAALLLRLFAHSIYALDPKLGACLELAEWRGGNETLETALFAAADCVTATGGDETLLNIRSRLPAQTRFLGYGRRVSFGFVTREMLREEEISRVVAWAADDVIAWDQNGCLSPHVIYVEERGEVESDRFAALLAAELMRRESVEPRGKVSVQESADIAARRSMYETLAAHRGDVKLWSSPNSTAWTVVFEHDVHFRFSPLNRFVFVKPVPDVAAVLSGVDEIIGKVSTVGIAAPPEQAGALALQFARWGVTRVCPLGRMQNPPLTWRHDGRPAFGDLILWTDVEA